MDKILNIIIVNLVTIILIGLMISVSAGEKDNSSLKETIKSIQDKPAETRVLKYLELVNVARKSKKGKEHYLIPVIKEILLCQDIEGIIKLEEKLEVKSEKEVIWSYIIKKAGKRAEKALESWANQNPDVPILLKYHPNGTELMLEILENENASITDRNTCAYLLGESGNTSIIKRIRKYENDNTPITFSCLSPNGNIPVLGETVKKSVKKLIKLKEKEQNKDKPDNNGSSSDGNTSNITAKSTNTASAKNKVTPDTNTKLQDINSGNYTYYIIGIGLTVLLIAVVYVTIKKKRK